MPEYINVDVDETPVYIHESGTERVFRLTRNGWMNITPSEILFTPEQQAFRDKCFSSLIG